MEQTELLTPVPMSPSMSIANAANSILFTLFIFAFIGYNIYRLHKGWRPLCICYPFCCFPVACGCCGVWQRGKDEPRQACCGGGDDTIPTVVYMRPTHDSQLYPRDPQGVPGQSHGNWQGSYNGNGHEQYPRNIQEQSAIGMGTMFGSVKMHDIV
jgi:hypothetical protein